jgi:hypothetical protein
MVEQQWFQERENGFLVLGKAYTSLPCEADCGVTEKLKRQTEYVFIPRD